MIFIIGFVLLLISIEIILLSIDSKLDKIIDYINRKEKRK